MVCPCDSLCVLRNTFVVLANNYIKVTVILLTDLFTKASVYRCRYYISFFLSHTILALFGLKLGSVFLFCSYTGKPLMRFSYVCLRSFLKHSLVLCSWNIFEMNGTMISFIREYLSALIYLLTIICNM